MAADEEPRVSDIEESIDIQSPLRTVYDHWTQFEGFPMFMEGITEVSQLDDTHLRWVAEIAGRRYEWVAEITEQKPDERIAWTCVDGTDNAGVVTFHRVGEDTTTVMVQIDFVADGVVEKIAKVLGVTDRRVKGDLQRFREMVEAGGDPPKGWRGEITRPAEAAPTRPSAEPQRAGETSPMSEHHNQTNIDDRSTGAGQHSETDEPDPIIQDVSTPFSPHEKDETALGDTDQHSTA